MTKTDKEKQVDLRNGCVGCLAVILFIIIGVGSCSLLFPAKKQTEAEGQNEFYQGYFFSTCIRSLKKNLRDPDSYQDDGEYSTSQDTGNQKTITWNFRSKNGFGGYGISSAICLVDKKTKSVTTTLVGN